jgi:hypothetical protein
VIDRPIPELLNISPETPLEVSTDGKQLIVAPAKPSARLAMERLFESWPSEREDPASLSLDEILEIHAQQMEGYGGSSGLGAAAGRIGVANSGIWVTVPAGREPLKGAPREFSATRGPSRVSFSKVRVLTFNTNALAVLLKFRRFEHNTFCPRFR